MTRLLTALALAASLPGLAFAGEDENSRLEAGIEMIAVIDAWDLDASLAATLGLDEYDGPVVLVDVAADSATEYYVRYDTLLADLGPLSAFEELAWLDSDNARVPVILSSYLDRELVAEQFIADVEPEAISGLMDTSMIDADVLQDLGSEFTGSNIIATLAGPAAHDAEVDRTTLDDELVAAVSERWIDGDLYELMMPDPSADALIGMLCETSTGSECVIAQRPDRPTWTMWLAGPPELVDVPEDEPEAEEPSDEGPETDGRPADDNETSEPETEEPADEPETEEPPAESETETTPRSDDNASTEEPTEEPETETENGPEQGTQAAEEPSLDDLLTTLEAL